MFHQPKCSQPSLTPCEEPTPKEASPAHSEPNLQRHLPALDVVRGLAVLMVTGYRFHEGPSDHSFLGRVLFNLLSFGDRGVDLFFVLSGFLITGILFDAKGKSHYFRNFYVRRALRIFPLYYGVLFTFLVLLPMCFPAAGAVFSNAISKQEWLWLYGTNLLPIWNEAGMNLDYFNHFWSLAVEEHFYLVWPFVIFFLTRRMAIFVCVGCIAVAIVSRIALILTGQPIELTGILTSSRMDALALGGIMALTARGTGGVRALRPYAIFAFVTCGILLLVYLLYLRGRAQMEGVVATLTYTLWAAFFGAFIALAVTSSPAGLTGKFWNSKVFRFFGKYSYGIYVFQNIIRPWMQVFFPVNDFVVWGGSPFVGRVLYIVASSCITIALAFLSWHIFEKHFLKLKSVFAR